MNYLIVIDFEANCIENGRLYPQEIIEFPAVPICITTKRIMRDKIFHHYCKINSKLTTFANKLTGITQEMCDNAPSFKSVLKLFNRWCYENGFTKENSVIVTCGNWDFLTAFPKQCEYSNVTVPNYCKKWINVKDIYTDTYKEKAESMLNMLNKLCLKLEGQHHSGIDDSINISNICLKILEQGGVFVH
jgi:inhibitor of KinA sporulation pathway (predicted exonuclease)